MAQYRFGSDHARFHRGVASFDLRDIEEAGGIPDQQPAWERQPRDRLIAAFVERPRAIRNAPTAGEGRADRRMSLKALEFLERAEEGIHVIEADDEADRDLPVLEMIKKRAAIRRGIERPADTMDNETRLMLCRVDLPQLFDADAVGLRPAFGTQVEALDELLGQRTAAAFGE